MCGGGLGVCGGGLGVCMCGGRLGVCVCVVVGWVCVYVWWWVGCVCVRAMIGWPTAASTFTTECRGQRSVQCFPRGGGDVIYYRAVLYRLA